MKRLKKLLRGFKSTFKRHDNMKYNNIHIIGIPEGEDEQGIEDLFERVMIENFLNMMTEKVIHVQEAYRVSIN